MRRWSLATAALSVLALAACKGKEQQTAANDDLSKDLAAAASSDGLALAPSLHSVQTVVSAEELSPQARVHRAPSQRASHPAPHRTPHRDRVTPHPSTETASVTDPAPTTTTEVAAAAPEPAAPSDNGAAAPSERPHPVDVPSTATGGSDGSGNGRGGSRGGGIGIGDIIGAIGGVIIRGGVVDGDHCDPRSDGRRIPRTGNGYPMPDAAERFPGAACRFRSHSSTRVRPCSAAASDHPPFHALSPLHVTARHLGCAPARPRGVQG